MGDVNMEVVPPRRRTSTEAPHGPETRPGPLHLGHHPGLAPHRRELLRMGWVVQGSPPKLDQAALGLRLHHLDAGTHCAGQRREGGPGADRLHRLDREPKPVPSHRKDGHHRRQTGPHRGEARRCSGNRREDRQGQPSQRAQVMIYQYAIPKALTQYQGKRLSGHVRYPKAHVAASESAVDQQFIGTLTALIRRLANETPARRVPSAQECRFCDIN